MDKTGLTGRYTFLLEYYNASTAELAARFLPRQVGPDERNETTPTPSDPGGGPNIFTAIQKQLGLRLDKTADVPLDMIAVESVDKVPTPD